ncbi:RsmB/NOP family class I SAM-dependent RNA methyltransferase [Marinovum sp. 2_MG-2023]|uniref:RsmB/NOP family class I SAM-dependent RNA methyltransferase n=1 Tax=unclassified Marinovum TaxID=2647166 RepID=UPI0026E1B1ED|nr:MULTISPECIES: RsmB/NOP family class I SAM-dependent RNA methyltransferase [unclassified Marinovum]MDO6730456.1 RsmB/NOP family class I SAM-dependent RNA methyltransferase [Marinovum sp. 2_MG-2023]MDO6778436.1 RsmB/NOP family class I SAM-dependent RNA methyltransferase [Marinovum sp. 1_MG-2023]
MTPEARIHSAAELLDAVLDGQAAEQALTRWARGNRYAGSKDRAAIRDLVFDALRCKRSYAAFGGSLTGRGLMIGALRAAGREPDQLFTGQGYAPAPLTDEERQGSREPEAAEARDLPDWLWPEFSASLGDKAEAEAQFLRARADVFLRVNLLKTDLEAAKNALADEGIVTEAHPLSSTALRVVEGARRVHLGAAYRDGMVELQDAASQAVVDFLPLKSGQSVLDFCAGGGGKALALAARLGGPVTAHDIDTARMQDIAPRAALAGADITIDPAPQGRFDLVLCDAPCSGSGSWRRAPEAKWRLTPDRLNELHEMQDAVLDSGAARVAPGGYLAYVTCSVLESENSARVQSFMSRSPDWKLERTHQFTLADGGDGFFVALLVQS